MGYIEENTQGRERLRAVVSSLSDEELSLQAGAGWTLAAILVHLAFWDFRVLELMQRWKSEGVGTSPIDVDIVNDATKPLCLAIPGREAVKIVLTAAEAVDAELEHIPEDLLPGITALVQEGTFRLDRSHHRHEHLDQIEKLLVEFRSR
jgi:hypothetical protein